MERTHLKLPVGKIVGGALVAMVWCGFVVQAVAAEAPATPAEKEFRRGRALFDEGRYVDAIGLFEKASALDPKASAYAQWLGRACGLEAEQASLLAKPGLARRSREALERAVALDPDNIGARSDLAAYYAAAPGFMGGGAAKAQAQVAEIRKRDPYMGQVRAADLLWDDNHVAEAERSYLAAVTINPKRADARARLGDLYDENGQYAQAFAQWDTILSNDPAELRALYGLGKTAVRSGQRLAEGEQALKRFLNTTVPDPDAPTPARAHYYLGKLLAKRGDKAGARGEWTSAVRLDPKLKEAQQALDALGK